MSQFEVVRDPLWDNIRLEPEALAVVDTPALQRLRYVRQLGHAFLVYPGATHTRFEHALGAYHLARRALAQLEEVAGCPPAPPADLRRLKLAALLHDVGHYPFSHALEEAGLPHHEELAGRHLHAGELAAQLARLGTAPDTLLSLIQGKRQGPLAGLVSGSLDVDKLDYLSRDAWMCGVPYGVIDVDRLLASLIVVPGADGQPALGLHDKGLAALESLLFAKYQMYRNVYWHHAVRSATVMFTRLVRVAIAAGRLRADDVALATDDVLIHDLQREDTTGLAQALRERRLAKRALDLPATELPGEPATWPAADPDLRGRVEDCLARELGLAEHELFLDFPAKPDMLALDLPLVKRDGTVTHLAGAEATEYLGLPRVAAELYLAWRRGKACSVLGGHRLRLGVARRSGLDRVNPHDDRRDVVEPAVAIRLGDEGVHLLLRRAPGRQHLGQLAVLEHPREPVRGEQEHVQQLHRPDVHVGDDVAVRADAAGDHVAVGVTARLFRRQVSSVHLLLHVRVVLGELHQLAVPQQVSPAVPHLPHEEAGVVQHERGDGGPHTALVVLGERALKNGAVRGADRRAHPVGHLLVRERVGRAELARHVPHRHFTRDLARRVTAHAIRHDEDAAVGDHDVVVFVT